MVAAKTLLVGVRYLLAVSKRTAFLVSIISSVSSHAGVCDVAWDGQKIGAAIANAPASLSLPLRDQNKNATQISAGQIQAFFEANNRISAVASKSPKFVICSGAEPNAFATTGPNGDVVGVTIGMLKLIDGDRDMAAAVIGHELGHHVHSHQTASQTRDAIIGLLSLVAGVALENKFQTRGGARGVGVDLAQVGGLLVSRKFDRDQEREADDAAFRYMISTGYNPVGAVRLAQRMNQVGAGGAGWFFDSHPGWSERADRIRTMIASSTEAQQIIARASA